MHKKRYPLLFYFLGACFLTGGLCGFASLYVAERGYLCATGVVKNVDHRRVYRHRKMRTVSHTDIYYDTERYGLLCLALDYHVPFLMDEGDELSVLYHPDHPRETRLPLPEGLLYGLLLALGGGCLWIGWALRGAPPREGRA